MTPLTRGGARGAQLGTTRVIDSESDDREVEKHKRLALTVSEHSRFHSQLGAVAREAADENERAAKE
jgi:hypothetical protein